MCRASAQQQQPKQQDPNWLRLGKAVVVGTAAAAMLMAAAGPTWADSAKVADFPASGLIFKDSVEVVALDDPSVSGVTLYVSDFKRSLADKLSKDFFSEPSQTSVTCAATGPIVIMEPSKVKAPGGQEVFNESKGLNLFGFGKTTRVRRVYDEPHDTLLYVSYSTRLSTGADDPKQSSGRYRTSICALPVSPRGGGGVMPVVQGGVAEQ